MKWLSVQIGGQRWRVDLIKGNHPHFAAEDGEHVYGISYPDRCKIYIAREQSEQVREDTLVHELLHAVFAVSGAGGILAEVCEGRDIAGRVEERIVGALTPYWHRIVLDLGGKFPKGPA